MKGRNREKEFDRGDLTWAETITTWIIEFLCVGFLIVMLTGCGTTDNTNPAIQTHNIRGIESLVEIPMGECLYFDCTTGIVYWWNGYLNVTKASTTPTPYYSPNGLLYRYIPETGCLEEVERDCKCEVRK